MADNTIPAEIFVSVTDGSLFGTRVANIEDTGETITLSPTVTRVLTDQVDGTKHLAKLHEFDIPPLLIEGEAACAAVRQLLQWAWGQDMDRYSLADPKPATSNA